MIHSRYRSDAEQSEPWCRHPDPRWVRAAGHVAASQRHRAQLGPPAAYRWLAAHVAASQRHRADAGLLRELVMVGRLPESWIPPDHLLDLRARVRLRPALVNERGECQQRMRAVLYHHGLRERRELLTRTNRAWVEELRLPAAAREQITVALAMIDAV